MVGPRSRAFGGNGLGGSEGGGLDARVARGVGARSVTGVEPNSLVADALTHDLADCAGTTDPRLSIVHQGIRAYAQRAGRRFDVVQLALNDAYRPVTSGAFTLTENYVHTVEGYASYLGLLREGGTLVITRWLQNPPSEDLRTLGGFWSCLLYTSPSPRDRPRSRMPSSA